MPLHFRAATGGTAPGGPKHPAGIDFVRLSVVAPEEIAAHMSDPRVAVHMPLLTDAWTADTAAAFVAAKEDRWRRGGLGHWAFLADGRYAGWGGFQREGKEWDFGLVLKPEAFGLGTRITRMAIDFARADERIPYITFLLPPSRHHLGALLRLGAHFVAEVEHGGAVFRKYRLDTN